MNTIAIKPTSPIGEKYWAELKDLSNSVKLELITLLSSSITPSETEKNSDKEWTKSFAGRWQDERTTEEIINEIRAARSGSVREIKL